MLSSQDIQWINEHLSEDPSRLRLKYASQPQISHLITQIECRKKAVKKLADTLQCEAFEFPNTLAQEQATSDRLAAFHASLVELGTSCIDLTAGLGIDALHLAQRCSRVIAVERNPEVAQTLRDNASALHINNLEVITGDCRDVITSFSHADTVFIDPARRGAMGERIFALSDCEPDVIAMLPHISRIADNLIIKMSPMLDVSAVLKQLQGICTRIIATGDRRECKELVAVCALGSTSCATPVIEALTLLPDNSQNSVEFTRYEEDEASIIYEQPQQGLYLIDPYPTIMKTAPWRLLCTRYAIGAIADNTHLYIAKSPVDSIGENFIIDEIIPYRSSEIKRLARRYPALSVATRNFGLRADQLRSKLKVRDADSPRLYGVTDHSGNQLMLICHKA